MKKSYITLEEALAAEKKEEEALNSLQRANGYYQWLLFGSYNMFKKQEFNPESGS